MANTKLKPYKYLEKLRIFITTFCIIIKSLKIPYLSLKNFYNTLKSSKILLLLLLPILLSSCGNENYCIESDSFKEDAFFVKAKPDKISGTYNPINGGQIAEWQDTGFKSNGQGFVIEISGGWSPWSGKPNSQTCRFCASKQLFNETSGRYEDIKVNDIPVCVCYKNSEMNPSIQDGLCSSESAAKYSATDYGVYHTNLNMMNRNKVLKNSSDQMDCSYRNGMGLYLGLFGASGRDIPIRAYHLFSEDQICNIVRNKDGKCIDADGNDVTKYLFYSRDIDGNKIVQNTIKNGDGEVDGVSLTGSPYIFVKDDLAKNDGEDKIKSDNKFHQPKEVVKLTIYDQFYSDNSGGFRVNFLKGIQVSKEIGIVEYVVGTFEDLILGRVNSNGVREGGIIKSLYEKIVQDKIFIRTLQLSLFLYVIFYGLSVALGLIEVSFKDFINRVIKIALIIFFISPTSWQNYYNYVISFFKDGMDYIIANLMDISDAIYNKIDAKTSLINIAKLDRETATSNATRFSYADEVIKTLFSENVAKKTSSLILSYFIGIFYFIIIYTLIIAFFLMIMKAAFIYIVNIIKLMLVLALGPIFIIFSLFNNTQQSFKQWLSFIGSRSLEIIFLFLVFYNMLIIIEKEFITLLSFRACVVDHPIFYKYFLAKTSREAWAPLFIKIGGMIFIMNSIIDQIPQIAPKIISIGGVRDEGGASSFSAFNEISSAIKSFGSHIGENAAKSVGIKIWDGAVFIYRASKDPSSIGDMVKGVIFGKSSSHIDDKIKSTIKEGKVKGLSGKELERFVRKSVMSDALRNKGSLFGNAKRITDLASSRLDNALIKNPLKNFINSRSKDLRSKGLYGKDLKNQLQKDVKKWADKNLIAGDKSVNKHMKNFNSLIKENSRLSGREAYNALANDKLNANEYLVHLAAKKAKQDLIKNNKTKNKKLDEDHNDFLRELRNRSNRNKEITKDNADLVSNIRKGNLLGIEYYKAKISLKREIYDNEVVDKINKVVDKFRDLYNWYKDRNNNNRLKKYDKKYDNKNAKKYYKIAQEIRSLDSKFYDQSIQKQIEIMDKYIDDKNKAVTEKMQKKVDDINDKFNELIKEERSTLNNLRFDNKLQLNEKVDISNFTGSDEFKNYFAGFKFNEALQGKDSSTVIDNSKAIQEAKFMQNIANMSLKSKNYQLRMKEFEKQQLEIKMHNALGNEKIKIEQQISSLDNEISGLSKDITMDQERLSATENYISTLESSQQ
jgi:type IV secretory pathway VirB6-like protein